MDIAKVLLFEGVNRKGGKRMFGKHCVRKKTVFSPVLGRNIQRCARFSGTGSGLAAFPISMDQLKDTGMTAMIAIAAALAVRRLADWAYSQTSIEPTTLRWLKPLSEAAAGIGAGWAIGNYTGRGEIAAAVALGPAIVNGMEQAAMLIAPSAPTAGYGGYNPNLGMVVDQSALTPGWATNDPYLYQVAGQIPAWSMGS
jgi:hypothetical protein